MKSPAASTTAASRPLLSIYTGAGLLDRGFIKAGFYVLSAGDILTGHDVRKFWPCRHVHEGVFGGPPCQGFSGANRRGKGYFASLRGVYEFARVVIAACPDWFLCECTPTVPDLGPILARLYGCADPGVEPYRVQRFNVNPREFGFPQNRLRAFQFGSRDGVGVVLDRRVTREAAGGLFNVAEKLEIAAEFKPENRAVLASEGRKKNRRAFADVCELQGLPRNFLAQSNLSQAFKYQLVGNGSCPVQLAEVIANAIRQRHETRWQRVCVCQCGRPVPDGVTMATPACRKRMQRRRDGAAVTQPGPVTSRLSQERAAA